MLSYTVSSNDIEFCLTVQPLRQYNWKGIIWVVGTDEIYVGASPRNPGQESPSSCPRIVHSRVPLFECTWSSCLHAAEVAVPSQESEVELAQCGHVCSLVAQEPANWCVGMKWCWTYGGGKNGGRSGQLEVQCRVLSGRQRCISERLDEQAGRIPANSPRLV